MKWRRTGGLRGQLEPRYAVGVRKHVARGVVGLAPSHESRPLEVAHRARAGIGEEVELDVARRKLEEVPARSLERLFPLPRKSSSESARPS